MPPKLFLKNLTIPSPCSADWDSMKGNNQIRVCEHCDLSVHNLSQMNRHQVQRLVARSNGRLCVRYIPDSQGKPLLAGAGQKLHRISRRASRIAAGAFTATLSVTSAIANTSQNSQSWQSGHPAMPTISRPTSRLGLGSSLVGTVTDQTGSVIPGATIALASDQLNVAFYLSSDDSGQFRIDNLASGMYTIRIEAPGFAPEDVGSVYVQASGETRIDRTLKVAAIEANVGIEYGGSQISGATSGMVAYVPPKHPFVRAAHEDNLDNVAALLSETDVNMRDEQSGTTALEHAVRNANREMVQLLLSGGANPNARDSSGRTVLMALDEDATADLVWDLINSGAMVNLRDESGNTALMEASSSKNVEAIKTLLDAGAKVESRNEQGQTALMLAAAAGHVNIVRVLILAGADITARDKEKKDALAHAIEENNKAVIRLLKSKGALETLAKQQDDNEDDEQ